MKCSNRPGTWGPCRADIGALLLPACSGRFLGCQANATRHDRPWSNFRVAVMRRAAAFSKRCSLSVMYLGDPARMALQ